MSPLRHHQKTPCTYGVLPDSCRQRSRIGAARRCLGTFWGHFRRRRNRRPSAGAHLARLKAVTNGNYPAISARCITPGCAVSVVRRRWSGPTGEVSVAYPAEGVFPNYLTDVYRESVDRGVGFHVVVTTFPHAVSGGILDISRTTMDAEIVAVGTVVVDGMAAPPHAATKTNAMLPFFSTPPYRYASRWARGQMEFEGTPAGCPRGS